jgi:very-short-patch-repair endonuclease
MRKHPTPSEARLWNALRMRRTGGRWRRQHVLAPYVVDFFCHAHKLVVEVDGGIHRAQQFHDARRDAELVRLHGVRILRIEAELVERNAAAAVALILEATR